MGPYVILIPKKPFLSRKTPCSYTECIRWSSIHTCVGTQLRSIKYNMNEKQRQLEEKIKERESMSVKDIVVEDLKGLITSKRRWDIFVAPG